MGHAMVTVIAPLDPPKLASARAAIDRLQNPARADLAAAIDTAGGIHFASLHALASADGARAPRARIFRRRR